MKSISNVNEKAFSKIVVLADLETIQSFSLHNCRSLKSLFVDGSLGLIGQGVFDNSKLEKTISNDVQYPLLNGNPFYLALSYVGGFPSCTVLNENCISIIERAFCNLGVHYMGASSVECIGAHAFDGCKNLESILLNDGLKVVGDYAFDQCSSLNQIKINAKTLPKYLFYGCSKLAKAILGDKLEAIDTYAFFDCQSLHDLHLPKSLKEAKESAFAYLPLKKLYFEEHQFFG